MAKAIMIQGTMSNAGKSLLTGGLLRVMKQDGYKVALSGECQLSFFPGRQNGSERGTDPSRNFDQGLWKLSGT